MEIKIINTKEISDIEWESYITSFNNVFSKQYTKEHFQQKYFNTIAGYSYHSFLLDDNMVVGGCTVIPYSYFIKEEIVKIGLVVDVFICEENRSDPLALYRMYNKIRSVLTKNGICFIIAVPNEVSYSYWKNIVKWQDVGCLNYYVFPLKISKIKIGTTKLFDFFSLIITKFLIFLSYLYNSNENLLPIRIDRRNIVIYNQKYTDKHKQVMLKNTFFSYIMVKEENVNTCYVIDFYDLNNRLKNQKSLREAIQNIIKEENPDLIIFVGRLNFKQNLLIKVPRRFEPRPLYLTADVFNTKISDFDREFIYNIANWDFGLINFDVR